MVRINGWEPFPVLQIADDRLQFFAVDDAQNQVMRGGSHKDQSEVPHSEAEGRCSAGQFFDGGRAWKMGGRFE